MFTWLSRRVPTDLRTPERLVALGSPVFAAGLAIAFWAAEHNRSGEQAGVLIIGAMLATVGFGLLGATVFVRTPRGELGRVVVDRVEGGWKDDQSGERFDTIELRVHNSGLVDVHVEARLTAPPDGVSDAVRGGMPTGNYALCWSENDGAKQYWLPSGEHAIVRLCHFRVDPKTKNLLLTPLNSKGEERHTLSAFRHASFAIAFVGFGLNTKLQRGSVSVSLDRAAGTVTVHPWQPHPDFADS